MSSEEIDAMLDNLSAIKAGEDPRDKTESEEASAVTSPTASDPVETRLQSDDALHVLRAEVERLYGQFEELPENLPRDNVFCAVARWDRRNGYCKYNSNISKHRFNKQLTGTNYAPGCFIVAVNEKILEDGNRQGFLDTVRHELAHALAYAIHGESQKHNHKWKALAAKLGADPSSCHNKRDRSDEYKYYIYCPECGMESGKTKRSKVIKQPFTRKCLKCGHSPLSSCDADGPRPDEGGVVAVESLPWDNKDEWNEAGRP